MKRRRCITNRNCPASPLQKKERKQDLQPEEAAESECRVKNLLSPLLMLSMPFSGPSPPYTSPPCTSTLSPIRPGLHPRSVVAATTTVSDTSGHSRGARAHRASPAIRKRS